MPWLSRLQCGFFVLFSACGSVSDDVDASSDSGDPDSGSVATHYVELGTGQERFVPVTDVGSRVELVAGFQGGFHIDVAVRLYDMPVDGLVLRYEVRDLDGTVRSLPAEYALRESRATREGDAWVHTGNFVQLDIRVASDVIGDTVVLAVEADPLGRLAPVTDEVTVTVADDEP
ncbi:MAG: hypothetical protein AAGE52_10810 [Myxococcota bacterium]